MAALVEQPIKKRKLYDHPSSESNINSHLSHDEILLKRRNWDEVSRIYASYKLIKLYANSQSVKKNCNPKILSSVTFQDFEQAYFSMLNASQGCASVQRIVAEMIPRYVLYCPPALEAACRVLIQIGKWSTTAVQDKVNSNGITFETMKACYFGLVDISNAAISMTRDKLVVSNITSIIFQIQLSFLIQKLNGKGFYAFEEMDMETLSGTEENFTELCKKLIDNDDPAGESMWKLSSLTILRILFCCPQNMLSACFDFLCSEDVERHKEGYSFLSLIMGENALCVKSLSESKSNSTLDSFKKEDNCKLIDTKSEKNSMAKKKSEGSLIAKVLKRNHGVRLWLRSRLQKLCKVNVSDVVSTATTKLSELLDSFPLSQSHLNIHDDTDLDKLQDYGKNTELMLLKPSADKHSEAFSMTEHTRFRNVTNSAVSSMLNDSNLSDDGKRRKPRYLFNSQQSDQKSGEDSCYQHYRRSSSFEDDDKNYLQEGDFKNLTSGRTCMKENLSNSSNSYSHSSWTPERKDYSTRTKGGCFSFEDNSRSSYNEYHESTPRREANGSSLILPAKQPTSSKSYSSPSHGQVAWYSDGDPAAMDVFAASNQLWVGSLGRDVLESSLKLHFERFGPVEKVSLFSPLDFGLVEFKNIIDAVKAREYMQGLSPWGSPLRVKFLDPGLGSRGAIAGAAVGGSCHVYLGKVPTNRVKEEILKDFISSGLKGPYTVLHLVKSNALLMEFDAPEEAAAVMAHIRQRRRETRDHDPSPTSFKMLTGQPSLSEGQNCGNRHIRVGHVDGCVSEEELINTFKQIGDLSGWNFLRQNSCCFIDFVSAESASLAKSRLNGVRFGSQHIVVDFDNGRTGTSTFSGLSPTKEKQNSSLLSLLSLLCKKYNLNSRMTSSSCTKSRNGRGFIGQEGTVIVPTNTLCIQLPDMDFNFLDETEIKTVFNLATGTIGKVTKIKSTKTSSGPRIFVELNSVEAASMALKNMSGQLGPCIQIEYSNSIISLQQSEQAQTLLQANSLHLKPHSEKSQQLQISSHSSQKNSKDNVSTNYWDHRHDEFQSPKLSCHGLGILGAYPSGWSSGSTLSEKVDSTDRSEATYEKPALKNSTLSSTASINTSTCSDSFLSKCASVENFSVSHSSNHAWIGSTAASDKVSGPNLVQQAPTMNPLPATKGTVYMNREHVSVNLPWAGHGLISTTSMDQISPTAKTLGQLNLNTNVCGGLFVPPRISPLGQTLGGLPVSYEFLNPNMTLRPFSVLPPLPSEIPPPPPPPSSPPPPPPPLSNFPIVPPPPSSPPPPPPPPPSDPLPVEWKGALCKSGVQYCTAMAIREPSSACNYTCTSPEPTEWPVKLDVTKRTDFKSVKHTFHNTPPNKREVCRLFPFSGDNNKKGFEELINYLKQRECAGVVRIPEGHSVWSRILFLLPYSSEACTMLEITLHSDNSLIGLILSKETSFDWI